MKLEQINKHYDNRSQKMKCIVSQAEQMIKEYGWENEVVYPWAFPMKVTEILEQCKDYDSCTYGSKVELVDLINGLVPILNAWEEHELAPKIEVKSVRTGKVYKILKEDLEFFGDDVEVV